MTKTRINAIAHQSSPLENIALSTVAVSETEQGQLNPISEITPTLEEKTSAAIAHQLNGPLATMLLHLSEIKSENKRFARSDETRDRVQEMVDIALRATEFARDIVQRAGQVIDKPNAAARKASGDSYQGQPSPFSSSPIDSDNSLLRPRSNRFCLTRREEEVLTLITQGESNKRGGYSLGISTRTFEVHRAHIMAKLGAKNAADLVRIVLTSDPLPK